MEDFVKSMIEEHGKLIVKLEALNNYVYSDLSELDDKIEFANKCIQLKGMKIYEEALRARLANQGIIFDGKTYTQPVATIKSCLATDNDMSEIPEGGEPEGKENKEDKDE